jgi:hypothetical protein
MIGCSFVFDTKRFAAVVLAVGLLLAGLAAPAEAGPFRRRGGGVGGGPAPGDVSTAQAVADHMARIGRVGHWGGHPANEGVGMGSSPAAALRSCCYYGRIRIRDQGVARGANGMFFACIRGD